MSNAPCGEVVVWLEWPEACFRATADDIKYLRTLVGADVNVKRVRSEAAFLRLLPKATHVITWHFQKEWYSRAKLLKMVATPAAGRELVAWRDAPEGVKVHFGGFHGAIISESVVAFCLAWARGLLRRRPATGLWPRTWLGDKCYTIAGTRAVILGYGKIGKAIGAKLEALGVQVAGITRKNVADLPREAAEADWLILALPSDTGTDDILDARLIARLPRRAAVVNIGRGNAVDEAALYSALAKGRIAAAYLDVFKKEPTVINPGVDPAHQPPDLPNLIVMPHSSAFSPDYVKAAFKELKDEGLI